MAHKQRIEVDPVVVNTLSEIRKVIEPFMEGEKGKTVEVKTEITWTDDRDNKRKTGWSSVTSGDMTAYQVLMEGFNLVKTRLAVAEKAKELSEVEDEDDDLLPEKIKWILLDIDAQYFSVDGFIKSRLGGFRKGLRIRWEIEEGIFEFDPYARKLFQVDE